MATFRQTLQRYRKKTQLAPHCQDEDQTVDHLLFTFLPNLPIPKIPDSHSPSTRGTGYDNHGGKSNCFY
ncbi:hypothetical protein LAZ67_2001444 [Cordylochernes scorpioides]|uniref:Uncharacterized protein n=1 Tax=Cordylochernes scorpioides TaxID=51811 RepID=A0ABY6K1H8_9ARAC|nr:hypothetical protein LAZ67_2001444 [Cordylochernes scorpioides]